MPTLKKITHRPWQTRREAQQGRRHPNSKFYQSTAWRRLRTLKISQDPLCQECLKAGAHVPAQMVDHIVPINAGGAKLDINNLQSLCNPCHNRKSGREAHSSR